MRMNNSGSSVDSSDAFASCFIINKTGQEKMMQGENVHAGSTTSGTAPLTYPFVGKWTELTDQIEKITFINTDTGGTANEMAAGTSIIVWGAD